MPDNYIVDPLVNTSEAEKLHFVLQGYLANKYFIELVQVSAVNETGTVDVTPLITPVSLADNATVNTSRIYDIPVFQLQRANSAIVMTPVVGDIGIIAVCDKDISLIKANRKPTEAQTARTHSRADAIYLGGVLNSAPTQYIKFEDNTISIKTEGTLNISAGSVNITAKTNIEGDTTIDGNLIVTQNISAANDISDGGGSLSSLRMQYNGHIHYITVDGETVASTTPRDG